MKELPPIKYSDAMHAFTDLLGNALGATQLYLLAGEPQQARRMRGVFYERVEQFRELELPPQGNITPEAVETFDQFREVDWGEKGQLDSIVFHYNLYFSQGDMSWK